MTEVQSEETTAPPLGMYSPVRGAWTYKNLYFDKLNSELYSLVVTITGAEYNLCRLSSEDQWSSSKPGQYGKGLLYQDADPFKPNRIGKLGEMAVAKVYGGEVDLGYKKYGDKYDIRYNGLTIDIKTAASRHGALLVRAITDTGKIIKPDKDLYIAACLLSEIKVAMQAEVGIIGYVTNAHLKTFPIVPAFKGNHKNLEVTYDKLTPIEELEKMLFQ